MANAEGRAGAKQALSRVLAVERQLREASKDKGPLDSSLRQLRAKLREEYTAILFSDYELAKSKDVEGLLWKAVFYKPIEEFRRRMKKAQNGGSSAAEVLRKTAHAFQSFLKDAMLFYQRLVARLQETYGDVGVSLPPVPSAPKLPPQAGATDPSPSVARCLLFLGDLTRYSVMYSEEGTAISNKDRDWEPCAKYYSQAALADPSSGQPHNQLAVIATYREDELGAVYHYAKALSAANPFLTARENLVLLFEKSRQRAALLTQGAGQQQSRGMPARANGRGRGPARGGGARGRGQRGGRQGAAAAAKAPGMVAAQYVRLAGILFTKTSLEMLPALAADVAEDLEAMLREAGPQGRSSSKSRPQDPEGLERRLQQLLVVLVFCVHNATWVPEGHSLGYSEMVQRSVLLRSSLAVLFGFLAGLASALAAAPQQLLGAAGAARGPPALLPLALGLQWLAASSLKVPEDPDQAEAAARAELMQAAARLLPVLRKANERPAGGGVARTAQPLPEDVELRGFLPLAAAHAGLDWRGVREPLLVPARVARALQALAAVSPAAPAALSECEAALQASSRGLVNTKEWRALSKAAAGLAEAWSLPQEPEPTGQDGDDDDEDCENKENREEGPPTATAEFDPLEEDPLEAQLEDAAAEDDEDDEVILFKPMAKPAAASAAPPAQAPTAPQYALPHMQGFQWGLPDLGLSTQAAEAPRFAGTRLTAPPPSDLPFASGLLPPGDRLPAPLPTHTSLGPAKPPGFPAPPPPGAVAASSLFGSGLGTSLTRPLTQQGPPSSVSSALGEGYGWLDALEAQQNAQAQSAPARSTHPPQPHTAFNPQGRAP